MISNHNQNSRSKSLDAEVNLVPFIDLLSMCICFLLMTAVWIEVGMVPVKQSFGTEAVESPEKPLDLELGFLGAHSLELRFKQKGKTVKTIQVKAEDESALAKKLQESLDPALKEIGISAAEVLHASQEGGAAAISSAQTVNKVIASGKIVPAGGVNYGEMVLVMDVLRRHQISNLGIVPVRGNL